MDVQEHPRSANRMHIQMRLSVSVRIAFLLALPVVLSAIACVADGVPRGSMPANREVEPRWNHCLGRQQIKAVRVSW